MSTYGEPCRKCGPGFTANVERTNCVLPFRCQAGTECRHGFGNCPTNATCRACPSGKVSTLETQCQSCELGAGVRANDKRTDCIRCPAGKEPSNDLDSCIECSGTNFSRSGFKCEICPEPSIVADKHSECAACPAGRGPTRDRTGCIDCTGNDAGRSGRCRECESGYIASDNREECRQCEPRTTYVKGYSDRTGVCGCDSGFYDARLSLIVCLQNGFDKREEDNEFNTLCESSDLKQNLTRAGKNGTVAESPICLPCPPCARCERAHGGNQYPQLRDGYILGNDMGIIQGRSCGENTLAVRNSMASDDPIKLAPQDRAIYHAFLCDADTAVMPSDIARNGYFTNAAANGRCNHNCTPGPLGRCNVTMPARTVQEAMSLNKQREHLHSASRCSFGYDGEFCQSCAEKFYKERKGHISTCKQCADEQGTCISTNGFNLCYLSLLVGLFALPMLYGLGKFCSGCCSKTVSEGQLVQPLDIRTTLNYPVREKAMLRLCCSTEHLRILKAATFPGVKILITYAQVTGQLSHVLHVQYPKNFSKGIDYVKPLLDFWSIFFRPECNGYGDFISRWWMRVVGQPVLFLAVVQLIYYITWLGGYANQHDARQSRVQNSLRAGFLCYPMVCNLCFSTLNCMHATASTEVLVDDDRQKCPDPGNWFGLEGLVLIRLLSLIILGVVGVGAPFVYIWRVVRASKNGAEELRVLKPVRELAAQELPDDPELRRTDDSFIEKLVLERWKGTLEYQLRKSCCCCSSANFDKPREAFAAEHTDKLDRKLKLAYRAEQVSDDITNAFVESNKLQSFSSLTEAYKPSHYFCYWEAVDMLRKFFLVSPT